MFASQWQKEASVYLVISKRLADTEDEKWIAPSHTVASIHKVWYFADLLSPAKTFLCKNDWLGYYELLSCQTKGSCFLFAGKKGVKMGILLLLKLRCSKRYICLFEKWEELVRYFEWMIYAFYLNKK